MITRTRARGERARDAGFSLVELSVTMVVLGIIAVVVSTFVLALFRSEQTVQGVSTSSNDSQIVTMALSDDIRNARSFTTTPTSVTASVSTPDVTIAWECVRWEVEPVTGELTRSHWPDHAVGGPAAAPASHAGVLASGVLLSDPTVFSGGTAATASGSTTGTLQYSFGLTTSGDGSIEVSGQITNRLSSAGTSCWEHA